MEYLETSKQEKKKKLLLSQKLEITNILIFQHTFFHCSWS